MANRLGWIVFSIAALAAPGALAQSPFTGKWSGTETASDTTTCTCTGTNCSGLNTSVSCTATVAWSATVDSQGNLMISTGAATEVCSDGTTLPIDASPPTAEGQIPANGTLSFPAMSSTTPDPNGSTTFSCAAYAVQFNAATGKVSGSSPCTFHSTFTASDSSFTSTCNGSSSDSITGSFGTSSTPAPLFPIQPTNNITPTIANSTAQVSPPAALVGTVGSVYVFAHVRQSRLSPGPVEEKRGVATAPVRNTDGASPDPCVLAQLNANGTLTGTSASTMQAYTTGVLSSQSQTVSILNNVSTPNVAGTTFYVGYGSTSSQMISSGTYEGAVSVDGTSSCSGALLTGAAPNSPSALTGLWWNPNESGWGVAFTQRRNVVFGAWYTYDSTGKPKWYVVPNCALPTGVTGTSGTCSGTLYQVSGPTFFGTQFNPSLDNVVAVGSLTTAFTDANNATMTYSVNGQGRTIPITRQQFQSGTTTPAVDYSDIWWNSSESGWGMVITQQYGVMFLAWYVYDSGGNPVWYVAPDCVVVGSSCSGTAFSTTGPPLGPTFNPSSVHATSVGTITVNFSDANNASVSYTINGSSGAKAITRNTF